MGPSELRQQIKRKHLLPVYLLYGQDDFLIEEMTKEIIDAALKGSDRSFNFNTYYGADNSATEVASTCNAFPFLGDRRVVLVKDAKKLYSEEPLLSYILNPAPHTILILCTEEITKKSKKKTAPKKEKASSKVNIIDWLNEKNAIVQFRQMYEKDAVHWVSDRLMEIGIKADASVAALLVELKGTSTRGLSQEIDKIVIALGDRKTVSQDEVMALTGISKEYNVFELANKVAERNEQKSQEILVRLLGAAEAPVWIVGSLTKHFFSLWKTKTPLDDKAKKNYSSAYDWQRDILLKQAKNFTLSEIQKCFTYLLKTDLILKSQPTEPSVALTRLIHQLIHPSSS